MDIIIVQPIFNQEIYQRIYGTRISILYEMGERIVIIHIYGARDIFLLFYDQRDIKYE